ncbi:gustatory receptor [Homalodisca vitripennis]|nr:gustatory receptor [Homalodisca vitripennis]
MSVLSKRSIFFYQAFLCFPLKYSSEPDADKKLTFSRAVFWWGSTLTFIQTVVLCSIIYAYLSAGMNLSTMQVSIIILIISVMITEVVIFLSSAKEHTKFIDVYSSLEKFDDSLQLVPPKTLMTITYISVIVVTVTTILLDLSSIFLLLLSGENLEMILNRIVALVSFTISHCRQSCLLVQFQETMYCIAKRFRLINAKIRQEVIIHIYRQSMRHHGPLFINHRGDTRSIARIKSFMTSYQMLCDAAYKANTFYSDILTSLIFCKFIFVTVTLFMFFLGFVSEHLVGMVLTGTWALCHICYVLLIVSSSSDVTQAADETSPIICKLINRRLDPVLKRRLESFLLQLNTQNAAFSGRGFFQINRKMLTSLAATVITNLVILIQFQTQSKLKTIS